MRRCTCMPRRGLTAGDMALEPGEDIRVLRLTWQEALEMICDGRIHDAKSVAALLYYETFRKQLPDLDH